MLANARILSLIPSSFYRESSSFLTKNCPCLTQKRNAKDVRFGANARELMLQGVDLLADAVGLTLGPKGRFVILEQYKSDPKITKDGVTVAKSLDLKNGVLNIGAKIVQEIAENTNKKAGDGTTTATVLARAIAKDGISVIDRGANPIEIRRGVMMAVDLVQKTLLEMAKPLTTHDEILQVATISANGDKTIGELIASSLDKVGRKGVVLVNESSTTYDKIDLIQGMQFDSGYISPYFINEEKEKKVHFKNAFIVFSNGKINQISPLLNVLGIAMEKKRPLVIVADELEGDALSTLVINKLEQGLAVCAITSPSYGEGRIESLRDMAVATGGIVLDDEAGISLEEVKEEHLGEAGEVIITKNDTIFLRGKGKKHSIEKRLEIIDYAKTKATYDMLRENLDERRGRLTSGVAVIGVGGQTEFERCERKDRVTDALNATKAAVEEGIVAGGGTALIRCREALDKLNADNSDLSLGVKIVKSCLHVPCFTIAENAGVNGSVVAETICCETGDIGYDAVKDRYVDMLEVGIIDPVKVVRTAVADAGSVASLLMTAEAVITISPPEDKDRNNEKLSDEEDEVDGDEQVYEKLYN